ncbi:MAG: flagellar export chaperone FliS [Dongiaceae bacterium]
MNPLSLSYSELESTVMGATPAGLIVLSYDMAIGCLEQACESIEKGDIEARCMAMTKASDLVTELYMSLDHEQGGEIANNLGSLYGFILSRLPRISFYNDVHTARHIIGILKNLRDSWSEVDLTLTAQAASMATADTAGMGVGA